MIRLPLAAMACVIALSGLAHSAGGKTFSNDIGSKPFYMEGRQFEGQGRERLSGAPQKPASPDIRGNFENNTKIDTQHEQTRGRLIEGKNPTRDELTRWQNPQTTDARIK